MVHLSQRLSMQMKQSPQQVLLSSLLQLPILSLEQRISLELETNPLLEMEMEEELKQEEQELPEQLLELEKPKDGDSDDEDDFEKARDEKEDREVDWETVLNDEDTYDYWMPRDKSAETYERPEVHQETLTDHLLSQMGMIDLSERERFVGEYIIWNINENGYLS